MMTPGEEIARDIVLDVGHSTFAQAEGCVARAAKAIDDAIEQARNAGRVEGAMREAMADHHANPCPGCDAIRHKVIEEVRRFAATDKFICDDETSANVVVDWVDLIDLLDTLEQRGGVDE